MAKYGGKGSPYKAGNKKVLKKGYKFGRGGKPVKVAKKAKRKRRR